MTYQITYFSPDGHAEKMANALRRILPENTIVVPLEKNPSFAADAHLIGFDLRFSDLDKLPVEVHNVLYGLRGKTVFLFATTPYQPDDVQANRIHRCAAAALPHECDYRGLYLCAGEPSEKLLRGFRHAADVKPNSTRIRHWLDCCEQAVGHPNEVELNGLCRFAAHVLK